MISNTMSALVIWSRHLFSVFVWPYLRHSSFITARFRNPHPASKGKYTTCLPGIVSLVFLLKLCPDARVIRPFLAAKLHLWIRNWKLYTVLRGSPHHCSHRHPSSISKPLDYVNKCIAGHLQRLFHFCVTWFFPFLLRQTHHWWTQVKKSTSRKCKNAHCGCPAVHFST